jgi:drug/metabolite transporter (DMT)-like permease
MARSSVTSRPADRIMLGLALASGAYAVLAFQDAAIKWLVVDLPVWQVLCCRSLIVVLSCLVGSRGALAQRALTSPVRFTLFCRGGVALAAWLCYFTASRILPFGQLVTLWFAAPIFVVVLSVRFLGERVGPTRWAAVALGFGGTLVAADPRGLSLNGAAGLALLGALLWACSIIMTRLIARRETSLVQMLTSNVVFLIATGAMTASEWRKPTLCELLLCVLVGGLGGMGQLGLFEAIRRAPASLLAPIEYSALPWAFAIGYVVWADVPAVGLLLAASLISAAGLILLFGERLRIRSRSAARP